MKGPYTPRRRCLLTRTLTALQMARPPGQPDGCPKKAATFLAALGACYLTGVRLGGVFARLYDQRRLRRT
jgi:hypothetical protein